jgi:hypothetical protein
MEEPPPPLERSEEPLLQTNEQREEHRLLETPTLVQGTHFSLLDIPAGVDLQTCRDQLDELAKCPGVHVVLTTGRKILYEDFIRLFPSNTIAGDGSVLGQGDRNFDHHEGNRYDTPTFCEMMDGLADVLQDRYKTEDGQLRLLTVVDHLDEDNVLGASRLKIEKSALSTMQAQALHHLLDIEGDMDRYAGLYPLPPDAAELMNAWREPLVQAKQRYGWSLAGMPSQEKVALLDAMFEHTQLWMMQDLPPKPIEIAYEITGKAGHYTTVLETGPDARMALAQDGHTSIITYRGTNPDGKHIHSFADVPREGDISAIFDHERMYEGLNRFEAVDICFYGESIERQWHEAKKIPADRLQPIFGGNGVGGSFGGSRLNPDQLRQAIDIIVQDMINEESAEHIAHVTTTTRGLIGVELE